MFLHWQIPCKKLLIIKPTVYELYFQNATKTTLIPSQLTLRIHLMNNQCGKRTSKEYTCDLINVLIMKFR
jgi:hypothetical protein